MENLWLQQQMKCVSPPSTTLQSTSTTLRSLQDNFSQGRNKDAVFFNSPISASYKSGHPDLGSSFLDLLSGPHSLLQDGYRGLADQSQFAMSSKFPMDSGVNLPVGNGLRGPPISVGLLAHYTSKLEQQNNVGHCSVVSSKYLTSSFNSSSALQDIDQMGQLNSQHSDIASHIQLNLPYCGKTKDTSTGHGEWQSYPNLPGRPHHPNVDSSRKFPLDVNSHFSTQSSAFMSGCPRVFCMGRSGDLLMSNTGLLGVVCSCHCLHMSIRKFCEHFGLHGINPGDAVRMNSGETILQWRKLYFEKLGIRVPDDQSGWDWADELSITCHSLKSSASYPNMSDTHGSHLTRSNEGLLRPRQPFGNDVFLNNPHTERSWVTDALYNNQPRNVQATDSSLVKGFFGTLQGDLHDVVGNQIKDCAGTRHLTMSKYFDERSHVISQCFPAFRDTVTENKTSSIFLRNCDVSSYRDVKDVIIVDREAASSNIELRLGQPCQQSQTMGNPVSSLVGLENLGTLVHPVNSVNLENMIQETANSKGKLENRNYSHSAAGQSNSRTIKEQNQLNLGNNVFVNGDTRFTLDTNKFSPVKSSVSLVLPSFERPTEKSVHFETVVNGKDHVMSNLLCSNAQNFICSPVNLVRKLDPIVNGKGVGFAAGNIQSSTDSTIRIFEQVESSRDFAEVDERAYCSPSGAHVKNTNNQLSCSPLDASSNQKSLNSTKKNPGFGNGLTDLEMLSHQAISASLSSVSPTSTAQWPSLLQKQDGIGDHSVGPPGMSGVHANPFNIPSKGDSNDVDLKPLHCAYCSRMLDQSDILAPLTGKFADYSCANCQSNTSTFSPGSLLTCKRTESQLLNNLQILHNSMRSQNNNHTTKHIRSCQVSSAKCQSNCSCSSQLTCIGGSSQTKVICPCNLHKEDNWKVNDGAFTFVAPETILAESTIPSDQTVMVKGQNPRNICHASQLNDLPCGIADFDLTCKESPGRALEVGGNEQGQLKNGAHKNCGGDSTLLETSNISSGCSALAVTHVSAEIKNRDSSNVKVADTEFVDRSIIDEGSGIEKCSSPDEAFESEKSTEYPQSDTRVLTNDGSSSIFENLSSRSLLDELKLLDSMTWKKGRNQKHTVHGDSGKRNTKKQYMMLNSGMTKRTAMFAEESFGDCPCQHRLKRRRSAFSSAEVFSRNRNRNDFYSDTEDNCGYQARSHGRVGSDEPLEDLRSTAFSQPRLHSKTLAFSKKTVMYNSLIFRKIPSCKQSSVAFKKARPVVSGKYGEISNGLDDGFSKPPKIVSLSLILKTVNESSISKTKPKLTKTRKLTEMVDKGKALCLKKYPKFKNLEDVRSCDVPNCDALYVKSTLVKETAGTTENITSDVFKMQRKDKGSGRKELKAKYKEVRKRSLYELIMEGKNTGPRSFSLKESSNGEQAVEGGRDKSEGHFHESVRAKMERRIQGNELSESEELCCVCGGSNKNDINNLLECCQCFIRVHQACYGISRVPKGQWYCRPCQINARDVACVLCGYGGGAMTRALKSRDTVKGLLKAWNIDLQSNMDNQVSLSSARNFKTQNSITAGVLDYTVKQWVHMVCGLWTPGTRCPNVDTMSAFDVSGALRPRANVVCSLCKRPGGSCIKCRVKDCSVQFHPWCAHQKGLLQSEVEGVDNENLGFYGRCILHSPKGANGFENLSPDPETGAHEESEPTCARTEGYKGCKRDGFWHNYSGGSDGKGGCFVPQEQLNAWDHINRLNKLQKRPSHLLKFEVEHDCRKEYARYKQAKGWKQLVVYKSGIHALGLYTSQFISRGKMVVEYVGEIVGPRVADKREIEYQSGRRLQYKCACYFFRIDKEYIIDATRKGGIARFVNHSCLPNCVAKVISVKNEKKVVFFAERDIFPGEEITYDYHFNHEDEGKKIPCFCYSKNCRRYLN